MNYNNRNYNRNNNYRNNYNNNNNTTNNNHNNNNTHNYRNKNYNNFNNNYRKRQFNDNSGQYRNKFMKGNNNTAHGNLTGSFFKKSFVEDPWLELEGKNSTLPPSMPAHFLEQQATTYDDQGDGLDPSFEDDAPVQP